MPYWSTVDADIRRVARQAAKRYLAVEERDDGVQQAVMQVWVDWPRFCAMTNTEQRNFIYFAVRSYAKLVHRKRKGDDGRPFDRAGQGSGAALPAEGFWRSGEPTELGRIDDQSVLFPALEWLAQRAPRQAAALWQKDVLGYTYEEMATINGTTTGTNKRNVALARKKVAEAVTKTASGPGC